MSAPVLLPEPSAPAPADLEPSREPPALAAVTALADALRAEAIVCCHWKSNAHLSESVAGAADLDLLVDRADGDRLAALLPRLGFKRFAAVPWLAYPAVEDHLALDGATGRLVHLHLHYELTLGERNLKGYRLPWERQVLRTRRLDPATGLYTAEPTIELLMLLVRSALKLRARDRLRPWRGGLESGGEREYHWLTARTNPDDLCALAARLLGPDAADALAILGAQEPSQEWLWAFRRCTDRALRGCRTYSAAGARLRRAVREVRGLVSAADRRWWRSAHPRVRTDPRGGIVVALLGCDGAGKSTVARALAECFSWKLDVMPLYLGSGDGPASLLRWPLRLALRLALRARAWRATRTPAAPAPAPKWTFARVLWALVLSREKRRRLTRGVRARNRGLLVVCDRYPQAQTAGFNDGPLLGRWLEHRSALARAVARWEAAPYSWAARHPPDLVIKLLVSPEVTSDRKPGMRLDEVLRRVQAVRELRFAAPADVVEIDADAPLELVLRRAKEVVWERL